MTDEQFDKLLYVIEKQNKEINEMAMANLIVNGRIYDTLLLILPDDERESLIRVHDSGELIGPVIKYMRPDDK